MGSILLLMINCPFGAFDPIDFSLLILLIPLDPDNLRHLVHNPSIDSQNVIIRIKIQSAKRRYVTGFYVRYTSTNTDVVLTSNEGQEFHVQSYVLEARR